jgi:hypothetical protein
MSVLHKKATESNIVEIDFGKVRALTLKVMTLQRETSVGTNPSESGQLATVHAKGLDHDRPHLHVAQVELSQI